MDTISESFVKSAVDLLKDQGKTIVIITHRLSTVIDADLIIYLDNGKVSETGTHTELMQKRNAYYQLWKTNFPEIITFEK